IQSSSAAVGILQALAISGLVGLENAVFVLFGMNIGTCITAVLASIGANRAAKRTTIIHLMFNVFGTVLFTLICMATPLVSFVESFTPDNVAGQIANMHTIFNIATTLLLLPFAGVMAKIAVKILPETEKEKEGGFYLKYIKGFDRTSDGAFGTSAIAEAEITNEIWRMAEMVRKNVDSCFTTVIDGNVARLEEAEETEEYIDFLNKEILQRISHTVSTDQNAEAIATSTALFRICGNLERIGDHAVNIMGYTRRMSDAKIDLSDLAKEEVQKMLDVCNDALSHLMNKEHSPEERLIFAAACEQRIDDMTEEFRDNQITRMQNGVCSGEACVLYSEMLSDFERIGDHILNIGHSLSHNNVEN
ncbi:MAG: Na/Pi cotransporter family protein, partial [Firmicutes bacterium]|nr:Na/Pi cotransporter family protein [Bacillota bacterium]